MKAEVDHVVAAGQREPPSLLYDAWFWAALMLGVAVCEGLALGWGLGDRTLIHLSQWRQLLWLVAIYPLLEEWVFRGVVQPGLLQGRYGRLACCQLSVANILTSLLFASLHLFTHTPLWAVAVIVPSLVFGWFRDRYTSIIPGFILHSSYNLGYFALFGLAT